MVEAVRSREATKGRGGRGPLRGPLRGLGRLAARLWTLALVVAAIATGAAIGSFLNFAHVVRHSAPPAAVEPAPGAVVLTGGSGRVDAGVALLAEGKARRLLISGVHPRTTEAAIRRAIEDGGEAGAHKARLSGLFTCCVQLGREALDTAGNAAEARDWATARGIERILVVTSDYHMPRALFEMRRALPEARLVPWPVATRALRDEAWYKDRAALRRLLGEWLRLVSARASDWLGEDVVKRLRG